MQDSWRLDYLLPGDRGQADTRAIQSELGDFSLHGCFNSCREGNHSMESKPCPSPSSPEQMKRYLSEKHLLSAHPLPLTNRVEGRQYIVAGNRWAADGNCPVCSLT